MQSYQTQVFRKMPKLHNAKSFTIFPVKIIQKKALEKSLKYVLCCDVMSSYFDCQNTFHICSLYIWTTHCLSVPGWNHFFLSKLETVIWWNLLWCFSGSIWLHHESEHFLKETIRWNGFDVENERFKRNVTILMGFPTTSMSRLHHKMSWNLFMSFFTYSIALTLSALLW